MRAYSYFGGCWFYFCEDNKSSFDSFSWVLGFSIIDIFRFFLFPPSVYSFIYSIKASFTCLSLYVDSSDPLKELNPSSPFANYLMTEILALLEGKYFGLFCKLVLIISYLVLKSSLWMLSIIRTASLYLFKFSMYKFGFTFLELRSESSPLFLRVEVCLLSSPYFWSYKGIILKL